MKKIFLLFLGLFLACVFWGCKQNERFTLTSSTTQAETTTQQVQITFFPEDLNYDPNTWRAQRSCYFCTFGEADDLFPHYAFDIWCDSWGRETPKEMALAALVKQYNIPKEKFEEAIRKEAEERLAEGRDLSYEDWELPNTDILYTFDNEVIDAYYRRENPVVPDWTKTVTYESYAAYQAANP